MRLKEYAARPRTAVHGKEMAPTVSFGVEAGTTTLWSAVQRIATATTRASAATSSAFAF